MYTASSLIQTPLFMLDLGSVQINEFVQISEIVKYSVNITVIMMVPTLKTDFYLNIGLVTSMAFSRCFPNQKYSASCSFGYSTIFQFFFTFMSTNFFENLSSLCNYSRLSTSALRTGYELAFSSVVNTRGQHNCLNH